MNKIIPGGAHTYSKGSDQFPSNCPKLFSHGKDSYLFDINNNKYLDYGMGLRSVTIGYGNEYICKNAIDNLIKGNNLTLPSVTEYDAAKLFTEVTGFDMVKFAKNGSNVTTAALKLARAYTGKKYIACCKDHPFFSFDDWFIGSTVINNGVPEEHSSFTLKFNYNDINSVLTLFKSYKLAAIILEPITITSPIIDNINFLKEIRKLCDQYGTVLIFDEMITGFRWSIKGAGHYYDVKPDLATFGKGIANGFSVAALVGKKEIMDYGGIDNPDIPRTFLLSSTHGAEMCSLGALISTIHIYQKHDVIGHIWSYGTQLMNGINSISKKLEIDAYFKILGSPCSPYYITLNINHEHSLEFRTLFMQEMINNKIIMPYIAISYSHGDIELQKTFEGIEQSLIIYKKALFDGIHLYLKSNIVKPVFRKIN
jgi:glutamate-1-semialdehyde 2,1-aminomutase